MIDKENMRQFLRQEIALMSLNDDEETIVDTLVERMDEEGFFEDVEDEIPYGED